MNDRALVLGGGGVAGIAWITGLLFGLSENGVDLRNADLTLGTSAGSAVAAVAAQLGCPISVEDLYRRQVDPALQTREITPDPRLLGQLLQAFPTTATPCDRAELTRKVGQWALQAPTVAEAERRSVVAERLPFHSRPDHPLRITAVAAETGQTRIFDRHSDAAIGINPLLPETRTPAAEAGRTQAKTIANDLNRFWS